MKIRKTYYAIIMMVSGLLANTAMAQNLHDQLPAAIRDAGKLVVGTSPTYPPLEYKDVTTMELKGLDIDLATEIAHRLGLGIEWKEAAFDQLINSLATGRINMGASGMTDIASRRGKVDFVDYFSTGSQLFTLKTLGAGLKQPSDVCGKPVAVNRNGIFYIRLQEFNQRVCQANGLADIQYWLVDKTADARLQMQQKRVLAAVQGVDAIRYLNEQPDSPDKGKYQLIGEPIAVDYAGFGFAKDQTVLRDLVVKALNEMIADGSYSKIFAKWDLSYAEVKRAMINTQPIN